MGGQVVSSDRVCLADLLRLRSACSAPPTLESALGAHEGREQSPGRREREARTGKAEREGKGLGTEGAGERTNKQCPGK